MTVGYTWENLVGDLNPSELVNLSTELTIGDACYYFVKEKHGEIGFFDWIVAGKILKEHILRDYKKDPNKYNKPDWFWTGIDW